MTTEQNIVHNDQEDNEHQSQKRAKPNPIIEKELNLSIIHSEELSKFIPNDFPTTIDENGRIPLRRQIFNDKKVLRTVLTKPKKGVYMCNHCDKIFNTFGELLDHFDEFNVKRPHKCSFDDCPWKIVGFNRIRQLHRHEKSVHSTEKDFKCNVPNCNKKFGRVDLLNRHIKSVHENKTSRFNKKMSKEQQQQQQQQQQQPNSDYNSSNDELTSGGEYSPVVSSSSIDQQSQQQRRGSQYKHTIKFLTNSDDK